MKELGSRETGRGTYESADSETCSDGGHGAGADVASYAADGC